MPHWQSEQWDSCIPGVTCLHVDPQPLLTREGRSCLPSTLAKLSAWDPAPNLAAMPLSPGAEGGMASRNWAVFTELSWASSRGRTCNCWLPAWEQQRGFHGRPEVKACPRVAACWEVPSKETSQSLLTGCTLSWEDAGKPKRAESSSGLVGSPLLQPLCRELAPWLLLPEQVQVRLSCSGAC